LSKLRHLDGLAAEQRIRPVLPAVGNGLLHATSRADHGCRRQVRTKEELRKRSEWAGVSTRTL